MRLLVAAFTVALTGWTPVGTRLPVVGSMSSLHGDEKDIRSVPYSTRFGGSEDDFIYDLATDADGNAYVTGSTKSADLPMKNPLQHAIGGSDESASAFVAKFDVRGELLFSTYFGASGNDSGRAIALDRGRNIYVAGITASTNLSTTPGGLQPSLACPEKQQDCTDGFLLKLDPDGRVLVATYLGFAGKIDSLSMTVGTDGAVYLGGTARYALDGRARMTLEFSGGGSDGFVAKLNADATTYEYVAHIGTPRSDHLTAIAADAQGHAYVAGVHDGACSFRATPGAFNTAFGCLYVAKIATHGQTLVWLSRFGGSASIDVLGEDGEWVSDIALDPAGNIYIAGWSGSSAFPTTEGAAQRTFNPGASPVQGDGFVTKLTADGAAVSYSTFLGGSGFDACNRLAVDPTGTVHVVGTTYSGDLAGRRYSTTSSEAFAATLSADGSAILNVSIFGGSVFDTPRAISISGQGLVWLSGVTNSPDFPTTPGAIDRTARADWDGMLVTLPWSGNSRDGR